MRAQAMNAPAVKAIARGHWSGILSRLAPILEAALARPGRHVPCPIHGGKDGFRVFNDVDLSGGGICNTCGSFSDGFALLMWANDWGFRAALDAVARSLGCTDGGTLAPVTPRPPPVPAHCLDHAAATAALQRVWSETVDPDAPVAQPLQRYFAYRGIAAALDPDVVRFHPALGYYEDRIRVGTFPAMVSRVSAADGQPVSIHRTYLTDQGRKAPVQSPKKLMPEAGTLIGSAIRLYPAGPLLGITEGIETALAVRQRTGTPVWAGLSDRLMEHWQPPPGVDVVFIWADRDRSGAGQAAAKRLQERLDARGVGGIIHLPRGPIPDGAKGLDWADVWRFPPPVVA
jgi:putative DNA primase/helicase